MASALAVSFASASRTPPVAAPSYPAAGHNHDIEPSPSQLPAPPASPACGSQATVLLAPSSQAAGGAAVRATEGQPSLLLGGRPVSSHSCSETNPGCRKRGRSTATAFAAATAPPESAGEAPACSRVPGTAAAAVAVAMVVSAGVGTLTTEDAAGSGPWCAAWGKLAALAMPVLLRLAARTLARRDNAVLRTGCAAGADSTGGCAGGPAGATSSLCSGPALPSSLCCSCSWSACSRSSGFTKSLILRLPRCGHQRRS